MTFYEALEDLKESLREFFSTLVDLFEAFVIWLCETAETILQALIQFCTGTGLLFFRLNARSKIMKKKINRYMEYKRLALWLGKMK